jgi:aldehyde dehydrogenase (NAD+)
MMQSIEHLRYYAGWADKIYGQTIPTDNKMIAYTLKEPLGAAECICPGVHGCQWVQA